MISFFQTFVDECDAMTFVERVCGSGEIPTEPPKHWDHRMIVHDCLRVSAESLNAVK